MIDLAQPILGSKIVYKTDEFFAKANRKFSHHFRVSPCFIPLNNKRENPRHTTDYLIMHNYA